MFSMISAVVLATSSCSLNANQAGPASAPVAEDVIVDRVYFGRDIPSGGEVSEDDWRTFLAEVVTPRFPAGLTAWHAHGQWRDSKGVIVKEHSFVLELMHTESFAADTSVRAIMREYRVRFKQEAVLRIQTKGRMEFESAGS
jgi:hypothetical protein